MKVTQAPAEERQTVLNIEVEASELERYLDRASRRLAQRLAVPGFRPGKAPRWMVERVVGKEGLLEEALEVLVPEVTQKAMEQESLDPSAPPSVEVAQKEPLVLKATVPLTPTFELDDYRSLRVEEEPAPADEEQVQRALESLRREQAPWEPVDRPVELDDLVVLDLAGTVDGEPFFQQEGMPYIVSQDTDVPLPGFARALVGAPSHQQTEFDLLIPQDYPEKRVAGKTCHLTVKVGEVKARRLPELNDEFAKGVGQGFESLENLTEHLRKNVRTAEEERARRSYEERVVQQALARAKAELPPLLVRHEAAHLLQERTETMTRQGIKLSDYLERTGTTMEQLQGQAEEEARVVLLRSLLLRKVAEAEEIQVDDQAVTQELAGLARQVEAQTSGRRRLTDNQQNREALGRMQRTRKALERLVAIARGKVDGPSQDQASDLPDVAKPNQGQGSEPVPDAVQT